MTVQRNGILFSDNGEVNINGLASASNVPTTAVPMKGMAPFPLFGQFVDGTGAIYVRFV